MDEIDRLHDKVDRIETKIDSIVEQTAVQSAKLEVYNIELEKHIEGVQLARQDNALLKQALDQRTAELQAAILPIKKHVETITAVLGFLKKLAIFIAGVVGFLSAYKRL